MKRDPLKHRRTKAQLSLELIGVLREKCRWDKFLRFTKTVIIPANRDLHFWAKVKKTRFLMELSHLRHRRWNHLIRAAKITTARECCLVAWLTRRNALLELIRKRSLREVVGAKSEALDRTNLTQLAAGTKSMMPRAMRIQRRENVDARKF